MSDLSTLVSQALNEVTAVGDLAALDEARVRWLGKKGTLTEQLKSLGALPAAERRDAGAKINEAKQAVQTALDERRVVLEKAEIDSQLAAGRIDVTLPGRGEERGGLHPVTKARLRIEKIFRRAGFEVALHGGERDRLMLRDELGLPISSRECDEHARDEAGDRADAQHDSGVLPVDVEQRVVGADGGDDERCRHH